MARDYIPQSGLLATVPDNEPLSERVWLAYKACKRYGGLRAYSGTNIYSFLGRRFGISAFEVRELVAERATAGAKAKGLIR